MNLRASRRRSLTKAITHRLTIVCLDFLAAICSPEKWPPRRLIVVVSNIYTSVGYLLHERAWARIKWGMERQGNA